MERPKAIHAYTGEPLDSYTEVVIDFRDGICIKGFVRSNEAVKRSVWRRGRETSMLMYKDAFTNCFMYSKLLGKFIFILDTDVCEIVRHKYVKGRGYPYTFKQKYEAIDSFRYFKGKQQVMSLISTPLSKYLKYTFGLEFETSCGIIPEEICFRDGLVPLRDGSITGNEYSTVVLSGQEGLSLLYQQLQTLKEHTHFDKECSLHVHLGGFPLEKDKIWRLYNLCLSLEKKFKDILPQYTFNTSAYKASGKDYCKPLDIYRNFESMYKTLTLMDFIGDFSAPHPNDIERGHKWNVTTRYYWVNFINMLCYKVNKTVEFRFLRPSYNSERIFFWLYVFNAILLYAESDNSITDSLSVIFKAVYPKEIYDMLIEEYWKQYFMTQQQHSVGDYIGSMINIENDFFGQNNII